MDGKVAVLCFLVLLSALRCLNFDFKMDVQAAMPEEKQVHNVNTGINYTTIQGAINAPETSDGHIIRVDSGTYYEEVVVNKSVSLIGEKESPPVIDGGESERPFVMIVHAPNVEITGFTIQNSSRLHDISYGMQLKDTENITITNNTIRTNRYGVSLNGANNTKVFDNTIIDNYVFGIVFYDSNHNNIIRNTIAKNPNGIYIASSTSQSNHFCHNNLIKNTNQAQSFGGNYWDNGVEGNYWSNYMDSDLDHDGIGDTPYSVLGVQDNRPLMGTFSNFNTSTGHHVQIICNSTIFNFKFNQSAHEIRFNVNGENETYGFCRVCIPYDLMEPPYNVIIDDGETLVLYFNDTLYVNGTHHWVYFAYQHSEHEIVIIPEFPSAIILLLLMIATIQVVAVLKKKIGLG